MIAVAVKSGDVDKYRSIEADDGREEACYEQAMLTEEQTNTSN